MTPEELAAELDRLAVDAKKRSDQRLRQNEAYLSHGWAARGATFEKSAALIREHLCAKEPKNAE